MCWKNLSTWIKGGIIAFAIDLVLVIYIILSSSDSLGVSIGVSILQFPYTCLSGFMTTASGMFSIIGNILGGLVAYFILGALVGLAIQKFKKKEIKVKRKIRKKKKR